MAMNEIVKRQVRAFKETVDRWESDHVDAMECLDLEQLLRVGIWLYDLLHETDKRWRTALAEGKAQYDPKVDKAFDEVFDMWLEPCALVDARIKKCESKKYRVEGAREFRERYQRAKSVKADRA